MSRRGPYLIMDASKICRLCLREAPDIVDVLNPDEPYLMEHVSYFFRLEVSSTCSPRVPVAFYSHLSLVVPSSGSLPPLEASSLLPFFVLSTCRCILYCFSRRPLCCCVIFVSTAVYVHVVERFMLFRR